MVTVNVYEQYFAADCIANSIHRHAALVMLIATSENGTVRYEAAVTFFPHIDENDFAVSYDAYYSDVLYEAKGRRSKKREAALLEDCQHTAVLLGRRLHLIQLFGRAGRRLLAEHVEAVV